MKLKQKVERETSATVFERSRRREVIVSIEPPDLVGFRLKGTRRTYYLPADALYCAALKADVNTVPAKKGDGARGR